MATRGGLRIGSKAEVLKNLRELLRVAHKRSPSGTRFKGCLWTQQILSQYRENQHETNRDRMRALRSQATDYLMLLNGVQEQRFLWELDAGAEKKLSGQEIVDRSARRVGLSVPETYADREDKREAAEKYLAAKRAQDASAASA
ncbi:hypothetical protein PybrP1_004371 [[Pythium] brassicae (nom. inval.)]|nr:hypothetical protein PybrP1_004371 [[Pythium] brassicae (nom. inval.)]